MMSVYSDYKERFVFIFCPTNQIQTIYHKRQKKTPKE